MTGTIRCAMPCCEPAEEEKEIGELETTFSLITRLVVACLGCIALLVGILTLAGISELNALGTGWGSALTVIGSLFLLSVACLRCVKGIGIKRVSAEQLKAARERLANIDLELALQGDELQQAIENRRRARAAE